MLQTGLQGRCQRLVTQDLTAQAMGSGALPVLATPALAAMMEQAAWESVQPYLEPDQATVGSALHLEHKSPTPLGMNAWAQSRLVEIDGRRLVFEIEAFDQAGPIAVARHERFIVKTASFMKRCQEKGC